MRLIGFGKEHAFNVMVRVVNEIRLLSSLVHNKSLLQYNILKTNFHYFEVSHLCFHVNWESISIEFTVNYSCFSSALIFF